MGSGPARPANPHRPADEFPEASLRPRQRSLAHDFQRMQCGAAGIYLL